MAPARCDAELAVEPCSSRSWSDPLSGVFGAQCGRNKPLLARVANVTGGERPLACPTESGRTYTSRGRRGGRTAIGRLQPNVADVEWRDGLARRCTPGEAMSRRLKLVAAPAGSQSEPDSGAPPRRTPNLTG